MGLVNSGRLMWNNVMSLSLVTSLRSNTIFLFQAHTRLVNKRTELWKVNTLTLNTYGIKLWITCTTRRDSEYKNMYKTTLKLTPNHFLNKKKWGMGHRLWYIDGGVTTVKRLMFIIT